MSAREEALIDARADRELGDYNGPGKKGDNAKARTGKTRSWTGR